MNSIPTFLSNLLQGLSALMFPELCEGCNRQLVGNEEVLCIGCEQHLLTGDTQIVAGNEAELRFAGRLPFAHAASFTQFYNDSLLQHLVHGLKYRNKKRIGIYLGRLWGRQLSKAPWIKDVTAIIAVPLHKAKEQKRGYNQSLLIAQGIADATGIPLRTDVVRRVRNTESQTRKSRTERIENMARAFETIDRPDSGNAHVLLCDDVLTTGATMESCAGVLLAAGYTVSLTTIGIA